MLYLNSVYSRKLSCNKLQDGTNNEMMIWRVFGPMDGTWGWAQANVPPGTYRAIFEIDGGADTLDGFDDVLLLPGICHNGNMLLNMLFAIYIFTSH